MDDTVRDIVASMASGRVLRVIRFPAGLALDWECWAIYPDRDAVNALIGDSDAFFAQAEGVIETTATRLRLAGILEFEILHRGRLPWISVHGVDDMERVYAHRRIQP